MGQSIRWGIIGLGNIAHKFAEDLALVKGGELLAVASRSRQKAGLFKEEFNVKNAFDSYKRLFECEDVDVIYIATPHTEHCNWSIMAMEHGKHVLCEKPMGINTSQVEQMVKTAHKNQVFLMEALWSRFNPAIKKVKEVIDNGDIGTIGYLHADFAFYGLDKDPEGRLLNPKLAGGSLLDIGIYPLFLAYLLLGIPDTITAASKFYKTGAEIQTSMLLEYQKAHALLYSGLTSASDMNATISGSEGTISIHPRWHETEGYTLFKDDEEKRTTFPKLGKGYTYEIEEVHKCLTAKKIESKLWSHTNSLDLIGILDAIREQNGIHFPFE